MSSITRCDGCDKDITKQGNHGLTGQRADGMDREPDGSLTDFLPADARLGFPSGQIDLCVPCTKKAFSVLPKYQPKVGSQGNDARLVERGLAAAPPRP